ncbi:restriction endonuclease subunit S [Streptomyces griseosporeus]|uniref:restriction endonuclease subunit S n=1 Tax=Streptomyces griseosporeus TaxID=1910 RepID=UPI0037A09C06
MSEKYELPVGWTRPPLGKVLRRRTERASGKESLLSVTQMRGVIPQAEVGRRDSSSEEKGNYWQVFPGDIVYNTMRMWQGVSGRSNLFGIVSPAYTVCEPSEEVDSRFLAHLFKHPDSIAEFYRLSQGLVSDTWNLKYSSFATIKFALPPKSEQQQIADIIDAFDERLARVSQSVKKTQSLRDALIAALFTGFKEMNTVADFIVGTPKNGVYKPGSDYGESGTPIIRIDRIQHGEIQSPETLPRVRLSKGEQGLFGVSSGDILINRVNSIDYVGKSALIRKLLEPTVFESNMMRCRVDTHSIRPDFMALWLGTSQAMEHFRRCAKSAIAQASVNQQDVSSCPVPVVSLDEQEEVVRKVESADQVASLQNGELQKLRLLKHGLMGDLLTGRVRAAEAEATLP